MNVIQAIVWARDPLPLVLGRGANGYTIHRENRKTTTLMFEVSLGQASPTLERIPGDHIGESGPDN
jgi:hypothetical protein